MSLKVRILTLYLNRVIPKEAEKMFGKNWKTSAGGVSAILGGLAMFFGMFKTGTFTAEGIGAVITAIGAGFGLLKAKDFNVTGGDTAQTEMAKPTESVIVETGPSAVKP